jgi:hypothetical protein
VNTFLIASWFKEKRGWRSKLFWREDKRPGNSFLPLPSSFLDIEQHNYS